MFKVRSFTKKNEFVKSKTQARKDTKTFEDSLIAQFNASNNEFYNCTNIVKEFEFEDDNNKILLIGKELCDKHELSGEIEILKYYGIYYYHIEHNGHDIIFMHKLNNMIELREYFDDVTSFKDLLSIYKNILMTVFNFYELFKVGHGDLNPGNIMVNPDTHKIQLIDFSHIIPYKASKDSEKDKLDDLYVIASGIMVGLESLYIRDMLQDKYFEVFKNIAVLAYSMRLGDPYGNRDREFFKNKFIFINNEVMLKDPDLNKCLIMINSALLDINTIEQSEKTISYCSLINRLYGSKLRPNIRDNFNSLFENKYLIPFKATQDPPSMADSFYLCYAEEDLITDGLVVSSSVNKRQRLS